MIDFHVHSTASDGTCTPAELAAKGADFTCMALTDHDGTSGVKEFLAAASAHGKGTRLGGIELSLEAGAGYGQFHLLGLGLDPDSERLADFLVRIREGRDARNAVIFEKLAGLGIRLTEGEVKRFTGGEVMARPHFARALVARGLAADVKDAFDKYLGAGRPAYSERYRPAPAEAIAVIHGAGGVAVMAHPRQWTQDAARLRAGLRELKTFGLDGIEAHYQANLPDETLLHLQVARELGFIVTAGSDFHGANKPSITLGMAVADEALLLDAFFAALSKYR